MLVLRTFHGTYGGHGTGLWVVLAHQSRWRYVWSVLVWSDRVLNAANQVLWSIVSPM